MGLVIIDQEDNRIESLKFTDLDLDNDMTISIDFKNNKEKLNLYLKRSQVEALKRHVDSELEKLKQ